jgi:hypothetical protein
VGDKLEAAQAARLIRLATPEGDSELSRFIEQPDARDLLGRLLRWPEGEVRFWALGKAKQVYSKDEYITALRRAVRDRDEAVRDDAIDRLLDLDPDHLRPMAKAMALKLGSDLPSLEKVFLLWTLARLRAIEAIPQIEALRSSEPEWTKLARVADVVLTYFRRGESAILVAIEEHRDHGRMEELCTVAWHVLKTPSAEAVLQKCATAAPDEDCRGQCSFAISRFHGVPV